MLQEPELTM